VLAAVRRTDLKDRYFIGYNIVASGFITQAVCIGAMFSYGIFFKELEVAFGWSRALLSGASSVAFLTMGLGAILAGTLNDRIGPRIILTLSGAFLGLGFMLMSQLSRPWQLYLLYGVFVGIGFSTHDVVTLSTVARWFVKRRGMMSGLVKVGTGGGQLIVPLIAAGSIAQFGWRHSFLLIGIFSLAGLVAAAQLMQRDPTDSGLLPDGLLPKDGDNKPTRKSSNLTLGQAIRTLPFWNLCLAEFILFCCLLTTTVHIVPHGRDIGLEPATAAAVLSVIGGVSMLGRIIMGTANDRIGGKRSLIISFTILISAFVWLQMSDKAWMLFAFAAMYGFAHGAFFTIVSLTVAEFFGTGSHGLIFGMVLFCGTLGGSAGPLLAGYLFDQSGSYRVVFIMLTVMAVIGLTSVSLMRPMANNRGPTPSRE
jgi:MFS family permease